MKKLLKTFALLSVISAFGLITANAYEVVYCGSDGMSLRHGPGTNHCKIGTVHHGAYVCPTGHQVWKCGTL